MLKRPNMLLSSYANIHCLYCHNSNSTATSYPFPQPNRKPRQKQSQRQQYATVGSERPHRDDGEGSIWPELPNPRTTPTPYQILSITKKAPYSKHRFYELAKIYHPDRNGHGNGHSGTSHLPHSIKMERYRLIVVAHEILSDPVKRRAYDSSGAGWNGRTEYGVHGHCWDRPKGNRWTGFDTNDSPFNNATWEDWERWYQRGKGKQEPVYFSNGGFIMVIIAAIFFGGFGQSLRLGDYAATFKRQVEMAHEDASTYLRGRRNESANLEDQDQRLQNFLMARDPFDYKITDLKEDSECGLLPEPEACKSEGIEQSGLDHQREAD